MIEFLKRFIKKYLTHFSYFYIHLKHRIFIVVGLSIAVGLLDGFGLAMFFPLLEMIGGNSSISGEGLGGLSFLIDGLKALGIELNAFSVLVTIVVFFGLKGIAKFVEQYYGVITQQYFIKKLRYESIDKLGKMKYKAFVVSDVGRIQNTLSGEVGRVAQAYKFYFQAVQSGVLVLVYILLAVSADPQFAILVVIGGGLSNLIYNRIYKKTVQTSKNITTGGHQFQGFLIQFVAFLKYFKATGKIQLYTQKLKNSINYIEKNTKRIGLYNSILMATREPLVILVVAAVIGIQIALFSENIGAIVLSLMFFYRSLNFLMQMQTQWNNFLNMSGALSNMTSFIKELSREQDTNGDKVFEGVRSAMSLKAIYFSYNDAVILNNISLTINKNQTVAFVGESGSGKTTVVNLLAGLMSVDSGAVTVDDISIKEFDLKTYQERIGYITQEPVIFNDTIFDNVTFWSPPTPENVSRFWEALDRASISDYVKGLPLQENTLLGNNGILISGGQKQRFSIARELFKNIEILIMDEATSALDSETEKSIQENIESLHGKYTILIVAHRLSTIKHADKIVLMDKGTIVGEGPYQTLLSTSPAFEKMVSLQNISI